MSEQQCSSVAPTLELDQVVHLQMLMSRRVVGLGLFKAFVDKIEKILERHTQTTFT